ncbi:MAG: nucleotide exchange factor GrpE [Thermomicrobiales bacterium]|nr:nucleotide exchange factor GrpE [Thermomicrobiales bacterium]
MNLFHDPPAADAVEEPPLVEDAPDWAVIQAERDQYLDQLQRSMAEFANYRKRVDQERAIARQVATRDLLLRLLPIADDFRRAFDTIPDESRDEPWVTGMGLIERNLTTFLEREGVRPIEALGQPFDPAMHEAVAVVPGSSGNTVVNVFQNGYWQGDQILRPAMVQVGDPPDAPANNPNTELNS